MSVFKRFDFKVANMRNEQDFVIYPYNGGDIVNLQSDKRFIQLNIRTGEGIINSKNDNYANSIKLAISPLPFKMPENVLTDIKAYLWDNSGIQSTSVLSIENKELYSA